MSNILNYDIILTFASVVSALVAVVTIYRSKKQYYDLQKPILSCILTVKDSSLMLHVINNGNRPAYNVSVSELHIEGNGMWGAHNNEFSGIHFDLYPQERVCRAVDLYICTLEYVPNPIVSFVLTYTDGKKIIPQSRTIALCSE